MKACWIIASFLLGMSTQQLRADDLEDANQAGKRGDYATALKLLTPLASSGNAQAEFLLAYMYDKGLGVARDYSKATNLYLAAIKLGNAQAASFLGQLYEQGFNGQKDFLVAAMWAIIAADIAQGDELEPAVANKKRVTAVLTAGQYIAAQEMAETCEESNFQSCSSIPVKPTNPWPPISILDRATDADCKISQLLIEGQNRAAVKAKAATDDKQKSIDDDAAQAKEAEDKRKGGDNFNIETGMKRTGFSLDLPEVTISYAETSIATVHIKVSRTKINMVTTGQCNVGSADIPEFSGLSITMKTHTVYVPCPVTKQVVLSLPQFTLGQTTIKLPQITTKMVRKDVSFHVPQVTYRDYAKVEGDARDKIQAERDLLKRALDEIKKGEGSQMLKRSCGTIFILVLPEMTTFPPAAANRLTQGASLRRK